MIRLLASYKLFIFIIAKGLLKKLISFLTALLSFSLKT